MIATILSIWCHLITLFVLTCVAFEEDHHYENCITPQKSRYIHVAHFSGMAGVLLLSVVMSCFVSKDDEDHTIDETFGDSDFNLQVRVVSPPKHDIVIVTSAVDAASRVPISPLFAYVRSKQFMFAFSILFMLGTVAASCICIINMVSLECYPPVSFFLCLWFILLSITYLFTVGRLLLCPCRRHCCGTSHALLDDVHNDNEPCHDGKSAIITPSGHRYASVTPAIGFNSFPHATLQQTLLS